MILVNSKAKGIAQGAFADEEMTVFGLYNFINISENESLYQYFLLEM